jgi:hypothetical protein
MNKKGQGYFYFFMIGIIIFLLTFALSSTLIKNSDKVRVDMDCGNTSIATTEKISCTTVDTIAPFFISILVGIGGSIFLAKVL